MIIIKKQHGGKRKGCGRPLKYGEATERVSFKLPVSKINLIKKLVSKELEKYIVKR